MVEIIKSIKRKIIDSEKSHQKRVEKAKIINPCGKYTDWLSEFHDQIKPERYLEIGVASGKTLGLVGHDTWSVGVDPAPSVKYSISAPTRLFKQTSDEFFGRGDVSAFLGSGFELAFIDGLHEYKKAYRDIVNALGWCKAGGVILVHDVIPVDEASSQADEELRFWSGDVFRALAFIHETMPQLWVGVIPTYPTGLGVIAWRGHLRGEISDASFLSDELDQYEKLTIGEYREEILPAIHEITDDGVGIQKSVENLLSVISQSTTDPRDMG